MEAHFSALEMSDWRARQKRLEGRKYHTFGCHLTGVRALYNGLVVYCSTGVTAI